MMKKEEMGRFKKDYTFYVLVLFVLFSVRTTFSTTTYTVGASGTYTTIAAAYAVCTAATDYVIEIKSDYNQAGETWPVSFTQLANKSAVNTVTIRPETGVTVNIVQSHASYLFRFNGADYVIIDGRAGGAGATAMTIENTNTTDYADVIDFVSDATYNTIKYVTLKGAASTGGCLIYLSSGTVTGNTNNTFSNNNFTMSATASEHGIYSYGSSAGVNNSSITVSNNNFYDIGFGYWCSPVAYSDSWTISGNSFYQTGGMTLTDDISFVYVGSNNANATITGNYFGGRAASCGGAAFTATTGAYQLYGINFNSVTGTVSVLNNTFANFTLTCTGTASLTCIDTYNTATYTIGSAGNGNVIGSTTSNGSITINGSTASTSFYGIGHFATNASNAINYNTFAGITQNHSTGGTFPEFYGVYASLSSAAATLTNNIFGASSGQIQLTGTGVGVAYQVISWVSNNNATISNNTFQYFTVSNAGNTNDNSIIYCGGDGTNTISSNTIGATAANNMSFSLTDQVDAITNYSDGAATISSNTIQQFNQTGTGASAGFYGINVDFSNAVMTITSNTIKNITSAGTGSYAFIGINLESESATETNSVAQNRINNITLSSTGAGTFYGIYCEDGGGTVQKNRIRAVTFNSSNASANLFGIVIDSPQNLNFYNNVVIIDNGAGSTVLRGILSRSSSAFTYNFYHNTVKIYGTATGGTNNSNAFADLNGAGTTVNVINNIFQNTRTNSGGSGTHLAIRYSSNASTLASNYNYLEASGTGGKVGHWNGTDYSTLATYQAASSKDANSTNSTITIAGFGNVTANYTGNVQNTGTDMDAIVATDIDGTARHATTPWMGAYESNAALPVELLSFDAVAVSGEYVQLNWITLSECNNDYFTVERSMDGLNYEEIEFVTGAGNSTRELRYETIDGVPYTGLSYYRLKQTDFNGESVYSDIVSVHIQNKNSEDEAYLYPNPNRGEEFVIYTGNVKYYSPSISVYNQAGILIDHVSLDGNVEEYYVGLSKELPVGLYIVKIEDVFRSNTIQMIVH